MSPLAPLFAALLVAFAVPPGEPPAPVASEIASSASLEKALREAVSALCPDVKLTIDGDLQRAAQRFIEGNRAGTLEASGPALAFVASIEAFDPSPIAGLATTDAPARADRAIGDLFPRSCRFDRVGFAAGKVSEKLAVIALLTSSRMVELAPIPGRVEELAQVKVEGRLLGPFRAPRLFHMKPGGTVEESPLKPDAEDRFSIQVRLVETGEHAVEILADSAGGPTVIALRRVFVGVPVPDAPPAVPAAAAGDGLLAVEQSIARLRQSRGLPALQRDAALDAVAELHSRTMAKVRTFAHILPEDGSLTDRLRKAGYAHRSAGENIGLAEDALTAHEAVALSPAHLANLLDPRHRRLGLGAVQGPSPDGNTAIYLTEVLAAPVIGSKDPAGDVARALTAERQKRGLPALTRDAKLDALAEKEAQAVAMSGGPAKVRAGIAEKALDTVPDLRSAAADLVVAGAPEECVSGKNALDGAWTHVGIGALYANSDKYGPGRLWVLMVFAR